jgi:hypothetical protein
VRGTDVDDVGVAPDAMIQWVEADHGGELAFSKHRLQLLHRHRIALSVIECKVADLKRLAFEERDIIGDTYLACDASMIKKILDGPCNVAARMFVLETVESNERCFERETSTDLVGGDPV